MPCTVSGYSIQVDSTGTVVAWSEQKYVYLKPSRNDIQVSYDGGTTWRSWVGDPDLAQTYPCSIAVAVNQSTGAWSVSVPFTDTEVLTQAASTVPAVVWTITDPNLGGGVQVYYGPTASGTVSTSKTLKQLLQLSSPNTWQITSASYTGYPYGTERQASVSFSAGQRTAGATWADIGTTSWKATGALRTDDDGMPAWKIVSGSETATGCTVELSAAPASGKTTTVNLWVRP